MPQLATRMGRAKPSAIMVIAEKAKRLKAEGRDIVSFSIGVPNFLPGEHVYAAAREALAKDSGQYGSNRGSDALVDAFLGHIEALGLTGYKRENVSTGEVEQALSGLPGIKEASVYGVKVGDLDGRAGMASLVVGPDFDITGLAARVDQALPAYARPVFVRLQPELAVTGTFKHRKIDMVAQGFDPANVAEPLYVRDGDKGYRPITPELMTEIAGGSMRL